MSGGSFIVVGYTASYNNANIHPIRIQPETEALTITIGGAAVVNSGEDAGNITNPISAVVSRGKRSRGLNARTITIEFTSAAPTGYLVGSPITIAAVNPDLLTAPAGATGTYLGQSIRVIGTSPETAR